MNKTLIIGSLIAALAIASVTSAATKCSIDPETVATDAQLTGVAKVLPAHAEIRARWLESSHPPLWLKPNTSRNTAAWYGL